MTRANVISFQHEQLLERIEERLHSAAMLRSTRKMNGGKRVRGLLTEIAKAAGASRQVVDTWYNRGTAVSEIYIAEIAEKTNTNHSWLITGVGAANKSESESTLTIRAVLALSQVAQISLMSESALEKLTQQIINCSNTGEDFEECAVKVFNSYHKVGVS